MKTYNKQINISDSIYNDTSPLDVVDPRLNCTLTVGTYSTGYLMYLNKACYEFFKGSSYLLVEYSKNFNSIIIKRSSPVSSHSIHLSKNSENRKYNVYSNNKLMDELQRVTPAYMNTNKYKYLIFASKNLTYNNGLVFHLDTNSIVNITKNKGGKP